MQRFFVEPYQIEEEAHRIHINGTDVNHIKNVLRMKCGEDVWISDGGDKEYHCQMEELGKKVEFGFWEKYDENHTVVRFATSWGTKMEDIEELIRLL